MNMTENQKAELKELLGEDLNERSLTRLIYYAKRGMGDLETNIREIIEDYIRDNLKIRCWKSDGYVTEIELELDGETISHTC